MCFDELLGRQKVFPKSHVSTALANNSIPGDVFGRGRPESWCAGEVKEDWLLRIVDDAFKSCLLIVFSISVQEFQCRI